MRRIYIYTCACRVGVRLYIAFFRFGASQCFAHDALAIESLARFILSAKDLSLAIYQTKRFIFAPRAQKSHFRSTPSSLRSICLKYRLLDHLLGRSLIHSLVRSFIHSLVRSLIHSHHLLVRCLRALAFRHAHSQYLLVRF